MLLTLLQIPLQEIQHFASFTDTYGQFNYVFLTNECKYTFTIKEDYAPTKNNRAITSMMMNTNSTSTEQSIVAIMIDLLCFYGSKTVSIYTLHEALLDYTVEEHSLSYTLHTYVNLSETNDLKPPMLQNVLFFQNVSSLLSYLKTSYHIPFTEQELLITYLNGNDTPFHTIHKRKGGVPLTFHVYPTLSLDTGASLLT